MTNQETEQHSDILSRQPTAAQVKAAKTFLESAGFEFTTTCLRALAAAVRQEHELEDGARMLEEVAELYAGLEAVTI